MKLQNPVTKTYYKIKKGKIVDFGKRNDKKLSKYLKKQGYKSLGDIFAKKKQYEK